MGRYSLIHSLFAGNNNLLITSGNGPGIVRFDNKDDSKQLELGRIVEDSTVHSSIYDALKMKNYKNIDYIYGKSIQAIERSDGMLSVSIGSNNKEISKVTTKLLIGADGTNSTVRRLSGISTWGWGYGQEAIVCTVMVDKSHSTAWQKYTSTGPIAILPLWDNYSSIVWSTSSVEAKRLKELSPEAFIAELNKIMQTPPATEKWLPPESTYDNTNNSILSKLINKSKTEITALIDTAISVAQLNDPYIKPPVITGMHSIRVGFPLQFVQANTYTKDNIALIGDAAHSIHPQAGQGLNLGIKDADMLAHTIASALENGQNISDQVVLANYGSVRARNNLAMMSVVDSIHRLFNNNSLVGTDYNETQNNPDNLNVLIKTKQLVRTLGLLGVHSTGHALKNNIARIAMGL